MEQNMKKNAYVCNWIPLLYNKNKHNIVNQLYVNLEKEMEKEDLF